MPCEPWTVEVTASLAEADAPRVPHCRPCPPSTTAPVSSNEGRRRTDTVAGGRLGGPQSALSPWLSIGLRTRRSHSPRGRAGLRRERRSGAAELCGLRVQGGGVPVCASDSVPPADGPTVTSTLRVPRLAVDRAVALCWPDSWPRRGCGAPEPGWACARRWWPPRWRRMRGKGLA